MVLKKRYSKSWALVQQTLKTINFIELDLYIVLGTTGESEEKSLCVFSSTIIISPAECKKRKVDFQRKVKHFF